MNIKLYGNIDCRTVKITIGLPNDDGTVDKCVFSDFLFASDFMKNYVKLSKEAQAISNTLTKAINKIKKELLK